MAGRFSVEAVFKAVDRITAPVTRMQNRVGKFTRKMSRDFNRLNRNIKKVTAGLKTAGRNIAVAGVLFAGASVNVLAAGADFEQAITNVGAVSLQTRKQIEPLEQLAISLGRTTKFTATQAANAMEVMARAGFEANEILKATPAVLSAAAASGLEIAEVANVVSNVLKGMSLDTSEAARVSDVLALASARTNSTIGTLGESMKNVASTARQLNIPLEDVVASVAALQDVGLDASVAGSAFNVMLTKMASPSVKIQKVMRGLGISFKDAKGNMKPLPAVLKDLSSASKKMGGNFDQVAFLAELVGLRGQKAAANLSKLFETGKLAKLTKELKNATGAAKKMADIRMDTVRGGLLLLGSAVDAVKVKIFGMNSGPLKDLIDSMTAWVSKNEDLIATNIGEFLSDLIANFSTIVRTGKQIVGVIVAYLALVAVLKVAAAATLAYNIVTGALTLIVGTAKAAILAYGFAIGVLPKVLAGARIAVLALNLAFAANPVGLVITAIGAFVALAAVVITAWDPVTKFFEDLSNTIGDVVGGIGGALERFGDFFGFGDDDEERARAGAQIVSPQERVAKNIEEQRTTSTAEVTIRDESGRAEVTGGKLGPGLALQPSGAF